MRTLSYEEKRALTYEEKRALIAKVLEGADLSVLRQVAASWVRFSASIKPLLEELDRALRSPRFEALLKDIKRASEDPRFRRAQDIIEASEDPWFGPCSMKSMRNGRGKRAPELLEAIVAERGGHNNPAEHPHTAARQILKRVNARLGKAGYKPASVHAIARRIPKISRT